MLQPPPNLLRLTTWLLHVSVSIFAVASLLSWRFDVWLDLRFLPPYLAAAIQVLWALSVLIVPILAGPTLAGLRSPRWQNTASQACPTRAASLPFRGL